VIVDIDNRKIIERGLIELVHYVFHWVVDTQDNVDGFHQLAYGELVIEFGAEHNVADLREIDDSEQGVALIDDGNKIGMAATDYLYQLAQKKVGRYGRIVFLDNTIETHQGECSVIGVVGDKFPFSSESHSVNAVWLEDVDGEVRTDADNHQRHKQLVSTGELCDEKNARERCMHHASHYTCHTEQREILFGDVDSDLIDIPNSGKEKAAEFEANFKGPENMKEQIIGGQIKKAFADKVLMLQPYILDDSKTVAEFIKEMIAKTGENITVRQFKRIELGVNE